MPTHGSSFMLLTQGTVQPPRTNAQAIYIYIYRKKIAVLKNKTSQHNTNIFVTKWKLIEQIKGKNYSEAAKHSENHYHKEDPKYRHRYLQSLCKFKILYDNKFSRLPPS